MADPGDTLVLAHTAQLTAWAGVEHGSHQGWSRRSLRPLLTAAAQVSCVSGAHRS